MAEVYFYHLTRTSLPVTLADLLAKCRGRNWRVLLKLSSANRLKWLDDLLWTQNDTGFLAHGIADRDRSDMQPVLLTLSDENTNHAEIMMAVDGCDVRAAECQGYQRVCVIFDGNDPAALEVARGQWKTLTDAGLPAKYWSQESGNWQAKAQKNQP